MILNEIKEYLENHGIIIDVNEMSGDKSLCIMYKSGLSHAGGSRRFDDKYHFSVFSRSNNFDDCYENAMKVYNVFHYPKIKKNINLKSHIIYSGRCLSCPSFTGKDSKDRYLLVFDMIIKSYKKQGDN